MALMSIPSVPPFSSSSFSSQRWRYDVFLNFCGKDTRKGITDHIYVALKKKGIIVFRDDEKLERGKHISQELLKAIQESQYAIVIISKNYAFSKWCLIELTKIMKCTRETGLKVLPIFYHVDPSNVRSQNGSFAEAFIRHEEDPEVEEEQRKKWRIALKDVGHLAGWHVYDRHEATIVEEICGMILGQLNRKLPNISKEIFGIDSQVEEVMNLLCLGLDDVRFIGICGMGGIGKTTLAKVIYEIVSHQLDEFEATCFIAGIREESRNHGLLYLQKQLISESLLDKEVNTWNTYGGIGVIASRVCNKKVFIVLDDVDGEAQLQALAGSCDWFGPGSRIIITSRDHHLLSRYVNCSYEVKGLNYNDAYRLFCWKAFKKLVPEKKYVKLSWDIVEYSQGLPLALEVFGSFLYGRTMEFWENARDLLKANPNIEILNKLQISFDGLEELPKQLFLDIACFFTWKHVDGVMCKLESFGYYPNCNLEVLRSKCLINIHNGVIQVHDLVQKMGQQIVFRESPREPGKRSRLWHTEDIIHILKNDTGTDAVEGIVFNLPLQKLEQLNFEAFSKMKNLRMLQISPRSNHVGIDQETFEKFHMVEWYGDPSGFRLSNKLCIMEWWGYPLDSLPANFQPNNLTELIIPYSCIKQLWNEMKCLNKLTCIVLNFSPNLIEISDLTGVPNLKMLSLSYCANLCKVHPSIGLLKQLEILDLQGCGRLTTLPIQSNEKSHFGCSRLNGFSLGSSRSSFLKKLDLSCCSLSDGVIPSDLSGLSLLEYLDLSGNNFTRIPDSIYQLSSLYALYLCNLKSLQALPKLPFNLHLLDLQNCTSLEMFDNQMDIWISNQIMWTIGCSFIVSYFGYDNKPYKILHLHPRSSLWIESKVLRSQVTVACGPTLGSAIPSWFNHRSTSCYGTTESYIDLDVDNYLEDLMRYALFIVYEVPEHEDSDRKVFDGSNPTFPVFVCQLQLNDDGLREPLVFCVPEVPPVGLNGVWVYITTPCFLEIQSSSNKWRSLETSIITSSLNVEVKECGIRLIRQPDVSEFCDVISGISPHDIKELCSPLLSVFGPIKGNAMSQHLAFIG